MTNAEFYKNEVLELVRNDQGIALENNRLVACKGLICEDCDFAKFDAWSNHECENVKINWLYSEYKLQKKLTKREYNFCRLMKTGWLARNSSGILNLFEGKPIKD